MSNSKTYRTVYPSYALRLVQEVAQKKWLLKPATHQDRALRKAEWGKIAAKLNAEFNADFTIRELQRKIEHVKAKAHKNQVQRCKITGEKPPAAPVFDFSSDDDLASDPVAHSDGDASTSSEVAHQRNDKSACNSPLIQSSGDVIVEKVEPPRTVLSDVGVTDERERIVEVVEEIVKQSEETTTEHLPHAKEDEPRNKKVRMSPPTASSNLDNSASSPQVVDGHDRLNETNEGTDAEVKEPDWMADFKTKLVERLSEVPTERIGEVHRMIRHEIDSLYAEQIARDIQTRFKDEEQDAVKKRVLNVISDGCGQISLTSESA